MTFTKSDIIEQDWENTGFTQPHAKIHVETILDIMKQTLSQGEEVLVSGFGKFRVKNKRQRRGRNPATNEGMMLDARRVVTFQASGKLRDKVNGNESM